jgi:hypothetical protein
MAIYFLDALTGYVLITPSLSNGLIFTFRQSGDDAKRRNIAANTFEYKVFDGVLFQLSSIYGISKAFDSVINWWRKKPHLHLILITKQPQ